MNILHLSDIHFGRNYPRYRIDDPFDKHDEILDELIERLSGLDDMLKPEHIVFTGDIAWRGQRDEFDEALVFFRRLLDALGLTGKDISFCAGNHDIDRDYKCIDAAVTNDSVKLNDELYLYENIHLFEPVIHEYNRFCSELGVEPYAYPVNGERRYSYTVGYKDVVCGDGGVLRIVSFNTSMLASQGISSDKLWLGKAQIDSLEEYGIIPAPEGVDYVMSLFHHSDRFLHPDETNTYEGRQAPLPILMDKTDLLLCGHTESSGKPRLTKQRGGGQMLLGGATYYCDTHQNSFSMLYISPKRKSLGFIPYIYENGWNDYDFMGSIRREQQTRTLQAAGTIYENAKLICRGAREYEIPIRYLEDINGVLNNRKDFLSPFTVRYDGTLSVQLNEYFSHRLSALLEYMDFRSSEYDTFSLLTQDGRCLLETSCAAFGAVPAYDEGLLAQLKTISEAFGVKLDLPERFSEDDLRTAGFLYRLASDGYDSHESGNGDKTVEVDRACLKKICAKAAAGKGLYLMQKKPLKVQFLHINISLSRAMLARGPYSVDAEDVKFKLESFREGDSRTVLFRAEPGMETFFALTPENSEDYCKAHEDSLIVL